VRAIKLLRPFARTIWIGGISFLVACSGQNGSNESEKQASEEGYQVSDIESFILFDTLNHDFGTIIEGEKVVYYFEYKNTGSADLVVYSVEATCGCTTPDWSREPLKSGDKELLQIIFDTAGRNGSQRKVVTVRSNARNAVIQLIITANINPIV